jgi:hypothetical protein
MMTPAWCRGSTTACGAVGAGSIFAVATTVLCLLLGACAPWQIAANGVGAAVGAGLDAERRAGETPECVTLTYAAGPCSVESTRP